MKIDILSETPFSILLMNAMAAESGDDDFLQRYGVTAGDTTVDIQVLVNGHSIPFISEGQIGIDRILSDVQESINEAAVEQLNSSKLRDLFDRIKDAEWQIGQALRKSGLTD
jgi:DNA topoisomerase VI subunit B